MDKGTPHDWLCIGSSEVTERMLRDGERSLAHRVFRFRCCFCNEEDESIRFDGPFPVPGECPRDDDHL